MKRKYADRANWSRILDKSYSSIFIDEKNFYGHIAFLELSKVKEQLSVTYGNNNLCIVDDGYVWLQHFPLRGEVVLTSTFDQDGNLVQCYFDIVKTVGVTLEGIPYCDDLFIDVVALPNGENYILDEDELEEAYKNKVITEEDYEFAKCIALELVESLKENRNYLMNSTERYYMFMRGLE
jgi:predicted RNA-binding protein associated with RNAse of E/G family